MNHQLFFPRVFAIALLALFGSCIKTFGQQELAYHKVEERENLYRISLRYHSSVQAILDANPGLEILKVKVGQTLSVPVSEQFELAKESAPSDSIADSTLPMIHKPKVPKENTIRIDDILVPNPFTETISVATSAEERRVELKVEKKVNPNLILIETEKKKASKAIKAPNGTAPQDTQASIR